LGTENSNDFWCLSNQNVSLTIEFKHPAVNLLKYWVNQRGKYFVYCFKSPNSSVLKGDMWVAGPLLYSTVVSMYFIYKFPQVKIWYVVS
jgi:hypothetical protein